MKPPVELRAVRDADLAAFFEHQRDPVAVRMAAFTARDPDDRAVFDAHWVRLRADPTVVLRTIELDGSVAGHIACFGPPEEREVTYWLARALWGRGVAGAALRAFVGAIAARPLYARAAHDNAGSLRVLARAGFVELRRERGFANARGTTIEEVVLVLA